MKDWDDIPAWQAALWLVGIALAFLLMLALMVAMYSCGCPRIARTSATEYDIDKSKCARTPGGACVILNENLVSDSFYALLDDKITATEACLKGWYATKEDVLHRNYNWKPPARSCYVVYIPDDWRVACEDPEQQIYGEAPQEACAAKGFEPDPACPCGWRTNIQDNSIIVTTPNLYLFRQSVVELLTGWRPFEIWQDADLVRCVGF